MIVYRAYHPADKKELEEYEENLAKRQVVGGRLGDRSSSPQITISEKAGNSISI
jgi:hypothetical protein